MMKKMHWMLLAACLPVGALQAAPVEVISQSNLEKRVQRLERMLENPVLLQLSDRLAEQQREIQSMQDRLDKLTFQLRQQRTRHEQKIAALEARIADLEAQLKAQEAEPKADEAAPGEEGAELAAEYEAAMTLLKKGKYEQAASRFDAFLKRHPDADLAPNAAYWAGEAYMVLLKYKSALARFDKVIKAFPDSGKYHDSLYRSAEALYKLGKKKAAIARLKKLIGDKKAPADLKKRAKAQLEKWRGK